MLHYFAGNPFDRGEAERRDADWLERVQRESSSRYLPFHSLKFLVSKDEPEPRLYWAGPEILDRLGWDAPQPILLGLLDGAAHLAIDVSSVDPAELGLDGDTEFVEARAFAGSLSIPETGIIAQAKAQVDWHSRHGFCSLCGSETRMERGGQQRRCGGCNAEHFPRTDPVVIALVHDGGDRCLLGQSRLWGIRGGFYSCLSGFMDQGESIEEAVRREIREESGLDVTDVHYHSSQPWPYTSSLMIGCHCRATTTEINFDQEEMNDVRWFSRDDVNAALKGENPDLLVPGNIAIAHHLIRTWIEKGAS